VLTRILAHPLRRKTPSGKLKRVDLRNAEYKKKAKIVEEIKAKL
jgi:hypothetical protein